MAKQNFNDMTDGLIQGIGELDFVNSLHVCEDYIFSNLFIQISYDLHDIYQDQGGDMEEFLKYK
ncbi:hypothetical protein D1013_08935 [Euzebyella marina]|uniref:Uncharacterized protein n=1 Tax=Euzebyella marina TaxID=1761453 RepID=A0A3G2L5K0_9FLAO|nr:hypothetical protein [Euzebyella marina]AYN67476.1 hypothetical protein D1013_08935 [Euzebyella marina]